MEDLIECKQIVFSCESAWKQPVCDDFSRSDETGELKKTIDRHVDDRRNARPIQTILLPLSDVGGKKQVQGDIGGFEKDGWRDRGKSVFRGNCSLHSLRPEPLRPGHYFYDIKMHGTWIHPKPHS